MRGLESVGALVVSQKKEWGEILSGFEGLNRYVILDDAGNELFYAVEEKRSLLARLFLKAFRPFAIDVLDNAGEPVLRIERPFKFYFHTAAIVDGGDKVVGGLYRRFSALRRFYDVMSPSGEKIFELFGPVFHPWTFQIHQRGVEVGSIKKKWVGLLKEGFTDADTFGVEFPEDWAVELKMLALGAVFLIDFVHFENKGNR